MPNHPTPLRLRTQLPALLLAIGMVMLSGAAHAQDEYLDGPEGGKKVDEFARPGGYLSLAVGGANPMFKGDFEPFNDFLSQAIIIGLRGGQRFNKVIAFDVSLDYSVRGMEAEFGTDSLEIKSVTGFGNLKLYPFGGRIQPYAMGGVGFVWGALNCYSGGVLVPCPFLEEDIVFAGRAGGGLDFYLTKNIALAAEIAYVIPTSSFSDLKYLSYTGHLLFRF